MMTNFNFLDSSGSCPFYFFLAYLKNIYLLSDVKMSLLMSCPTDWVTPPQTFNITRKVMVATQHLHFISTQGVCPPVERGHNSSLATGKSFNRSDFLCVFHRLLLLPSGPAKASGTDPSCNVVITNPPHHNLRPPVSTFYELKAEGRLYAERFLTLLYFLRQSGCYAD